MALKIGKILNSIIINEEGGNEPFFVDYVPVYILNEPTRTTFKLSTKGDEEINGTIEAQGSDHEKLSKGEILNIYTFKLKIGGDERIIQLSGNQVNSEKNHGSPTLYKNVEYYFISGDDLISPEDERYVVKPKKPKSNISRRKNESFIIEADNKKGSITFTNFDINNQQVEDSMEDMDIEDKLNVDDITPDEQEKMNNLAFLLYGKDTGRLLPRYSRKYPGISKLFGLFQKGGYETSLEKSKEKWGVNRFDFSGSDDSIESMKGMVKVGVEFIDPVKYSKEDRVSKIKYVLNIEKGRKKPFSYSITDKILKHKFTTKDKTNINVIELTPTNATIYDSKSKFTNVYNQIVNAKVELVPTPGSAFNIKLPGVIKIKIIPLEDLGG